MNIIFDNIIFSLQKVGGISVVWAELIKHILNDEEFDTKFIDFPNKNIFAQKLSIPQTKILNYLPQRYPLFVQRYLNPINFQGKGIFHSSYYRIANNPDIVNITTVHDFTYEYFRKGLPRIIHHLQKSEAIRKSKKIICVSQNTKDDLMKFFPEIKEEHISIIYNGVDNNYQPIRQKEETQLKQLVPFSSGEYVLYVGDRKCLYKNFSLAVKACKIADLPLVIVGGGLLMKNEYHLLKETIGINKFKLLSDISNQQLNVIYNHALCLLYPSRHEGYGIPIVEAQRAGCPIISTNYSSIPEVAGKGAILLNELTEFHFADILIQIKRNPTLVAEIKEEGLKNSQRFSWDKCYQQTKQVYKDVYDEYF